MPRNRSGESARRAQRAKELGICRECSRATTLGITCQECRDKINAARQIDQGYRDRKNAARRASRVQRASKSLCVCGAPPVADRKLCGQCAAKKAEERRERYKKKLGTGVCLCGRVIAGKQATCQECRSKATAIRMRTYAERKVAGLCTDCGADTVDRKFRCASCYTIHLQQTRKAWNKQRETIIDHYGSKCQCCGQSDPRYLQIDHVNNDGHHHRIEVGRHIMSWAIKNNFPAGLQLLCANCNSGKARYGVCPHIAISPPQSKGQRQRRNLRLKIIAAYGGACGHCRESNPYFLELDHVNNDGAEHRRSDSSAKSLWTWALKNGFPDRLQLLCSNCNMAKAFGQDTVRATRNGGPN